MTPYEGYAWRAPWRDVVRWPGECSTKWKNVQQVLFERVIAEREIELTSAAHDQAEETLKSHRPWMGEMDYGAALRRERARILEQEAMRN